MDEGRAIVSMCNSEKLMGKCSGAIEMLHTLLRTAGRVVMMCADMSHDWMVRQFAEAANRPTKLIRYTARPFPRKLMYSSNLDVIMARIRCALLALKNV
jgi:hypothetical protein